MSAAVGDGACYMIVHIYIHIIHVSLRVSTFFVMLRSGRRPAHLHLDAIRCDGTRRLGSMFARGQVWPTARNHVATALCAPRAAQTTTPACKGARSLKPHTLITCSTHKTNTTTTNTHTRTHLHTPAHTHHAICVGGSAVWCGGLRDARRHATDDVINRDSAP